MKKPHYVILLLTLLVSLSSFAVQSPIDSTNIVIKPGDEKETHYPNRGVIDVPITAYFDGFTSTVFISFSNDLGDVDTEITNLYTSETQYEVVDAYDSPVAIPITGTSGLYSLVFTLSSGAQYIGEFEITGE